MYAVIDVETTGLNPGRHDRVVEVAVVRLDAHGRIEDTFATLVNPQRDLGPQHVHRITAADARRAPTFDQIAGHLTDLVSGRTLVAHNLPFDAMFMAAEYARLGTKMPSHQDVGLCTMRMAHRYLPSGRSLADCCLVAGVRLTNAHSALDDALAAAGLLAHYLDRAGQPPPWRTTIDAARAACWPDIRSVPVATVTRTRPGSSEAHFLSRLVARLPRVDHPQADSYLDLLDRALVDRVISAAEADALVEYANRLDLGRLEVSELHQRYLHELAFAAMEDGVITNDEHEDLVAVAALLGLGTNDLDLALEGARATGRDSRPRYGRFSLAPGDTVTLTGTFREPKQVIEADVIEAGVIPASSVTKKTRLLVAADLDTMSGKAAKARQYGIPIVGEEALRRLLAECVTARSRSASAAVSSASSALPGMTSISNRVIGNHSRG